MTDWEKWGRDMWGGKYGGEGLGERWERERMEMDPR